ncbi:alpha/beta hydrolase [Primorskyibacter flagellatus]|uniref:Alpha/beta hydrolase n=2 Tax=Primorskyibacter flagellatus TaxID=1387277 RepID=A0A917A547_9RHOB|nr:alpha/beta hydrolase [Primorskyibacter flagellatus]
MRDFSERIVRVPVLGTEVAVRVCGEGPDLLCLHATGHDGADFDGIAAAFGDRYRVLAPDFPGHGQSGEMSAAADARVYAEVAAGVIDALCDAPPVVLGNSIGGAAAILLAHEGRVRALVLCNPGGLIPLTPTVRRVTRMFSRFFAAGARGAWWFVPAFRLYYRSVLPGARVRRREISRTVANRAGVLSQAWESFGRDDADLRAAAAALDVPVLIAWARSDKAIRLDVCRPAIARIPDHRLHLFRGGHAAFLEDPEAFMPVLGEFLENIR